MQQFEFLVQALLLSLGKRLNDPPYHHFAATDIILALTRKPTVQFPALTVQQMLLAGISKSSTWHFAYFRNAGNER